MTANFLAKKKLFGCKENVFFQARKMKFIRIDKSKQKKSQTD